MEAIKVSFSNAVIGTKPEVLQNIHLQEKNIAIYHRDISHIKSDINTCMKGKIEFRKSGSLPEIHAAIQSEIPTCNNLIADIVGLLHIFGQVAKTNTFKMLLATVNTNMCRKFHTDINDV